MSEIVPGNNALNNCSSSSICCALLLLNNVATISLNSARFSSLVSDKWFEFEIMFDIWDADDFTAFQIDWAPIEALCSALLAADLVIFCNPYDLVC